MKKIPYTLILLLITLHLDFISTPLFAQDLPHYATEQERAMIPYTKGTISAPFGISTPPESAVRTMAEWEEIQALVITWATQFQILSQIVKHAKEECQVIIICSDSNTVINYLANNGVDKTNVSFISGSNLFNSIWSRDYAQWSIYKNEVDSLSLIDWIYNRNRPLDDKVPQLVSNLMNIPLYEMTQAPYDLVHTGGNFMVDGLGTGFSSELILDENWNGNFNITDKTKDQIDSLLLSFMGIERFILMPTLPYDLIHHIDMHMKLLDEETLLVGEYPSGIADGPQIEANLQYILSNFNSTFGTPYKIVRVPMPPENMQYPHNGGDYRTYTNAIFVNKTVLVPTYEYQYDTTALRIWREALPGYKIVGINSNSIIPLYGAIHCITKGVGTSDPMHIVHQPLNDKIHSFSGYQVSAMLNHRSGIEKANVYFTSDTTLPFQAVNLHLTDPANKTWTASIPGLNENDRVYYYINGESYSGKKQQRPMPAPKGYWKFDILPSLVGVQPVMQYEFSLASIYPNPSSGITVIPVNTSVRTQAQITISDVLGHSVEIIFSGSIPAGKSNYFFNSSSYSSGIYVVRIDHELGTVVRKVLVK